MLHGVNLPNMLSFNMESNFGILENGLGAVRSAIIEPSAHSLEFLHLGDCDLSSGQANSLFYGIKMTKLKTLIMTRNPGLEIEGMEILRD